MERLGNLKIGDRFITGLDIDDKNTGRRLLSGVPVIFKVIYQEDEASRTFSYIESNGHTVIFNSNKEVSKLESLNSDKQSTINVVQELLKERARQIRKGWNNRHDIKFHSAGDLAEDACNYLMKGKPIRKKVGNKYVKLKRICKTEDKHGYRENLIIAAALVIAEIERFDAVCKEEERIDGELAS